MSIPLKDITVVIPTYNEVDSVPHIVNLLYFRGLKVIVVDDNSPDGTSAALIRLDLTESLTVVTRENQRGLGSAIREGAKRAQTPFVLVMDGDGQHKIADVISLTHKMDERLDLIYGSRFIKGGGSSGLSPLRKVSSIILVLLTDILIQQRTSDPLSGLFIAKRNLILNTRTNGFKVLLDILSNNSDIKTADIPMNLVARRAGKSKMNFKQLLEIFRIICSSNYRTLTESIKIDH
jgi:dolichol-phosphate mannosyltransferase